MTRSAIALVSVVGVLAVCGMTTLVGQVPTTPVKPISTPPETLRSKLLGLVKERIAKMSDGEIRQAIEKESDLLAEVKAQQEFDRAMQALVEITKNYPETRAGKKALLLLDPLDPVFDPTSSSRPNLRVVPISVKANTGATDLLRPGDRVDVQWYVTRNGELGIPIYDSLTIQDVRVFAIDQTVNRQADGEEAPVLVKTISLLLTPKQANKVAVAKRLGAVRLIPFNPADDEDPDANYVPDRFGLRPPPTVAPEPVSRRPTPRG